MQFDKDVPIPPMKNGGWPKQYYFDQMQIMESQEFPVALRSNINAVAQRIKKRTGFRFRIRVTDDKVRIWRIE
jgi:hypothetical protein